jgi:hypothetical protein
MDSDEIFEALAASDADRAAKARQLRDAIAEAAALRDQTAAAHLAATRACNALVLRARMEKALPVEEILAAAGVSRAWLYSLKPGEGGLSGVKDKPAASKGTT